jgi:hypothetical protein
MSAYQYMVVPFLHSRGAYSYGGSGALFVAQHLQEIINAAASEGWELAEISHVNVEEPRGCLPSLFGRRVTNVTYDQIIFRRPT